MSSSNDCDVAIIGMAGRFPGARDITAFWQNMQNGIEGISFFADDEMEVKVDPKDLRNPTFVKAKGVVDDVDLFDAAFFNIPAREADWMDPQQRLFLQAAWEALEHAGYNPLACPGQVSVYAGVNTNTYLLGRLAQLQVGDPASYFRILLSNEKDHLATRVSYKLNLQGESVTIQTSCSTSLVAVHLACQSILSGQSNMALAGGVSIRVPQKTGYFYQEGMMASPDGHCRPFDAQAKGTVPGHGYGIVVLKLLADALRDRDTVHAVIKGSAANNDGRNKVGYTAPAVEGQTAVIARALAMSGVKADEISFVEAHGTGTPLGDPIEVEALSQAYRRHTQRKQYCVLGAVKSMIGHLDCAAGVAGLIKTVLALKHHQIPPTLHFQMPNHMLNLENSPFRVSDKLLDWDTGNAPRIAGLSSFGIGGTNVHMIVAEAPKLEPQPSERQQILTLSARSVPGLKIMVGQLAEHLRHQCDSDIADVAFTRNAGRQAFPYRAYVVGSSVQEMVDALGLVNSRPDSGFLQAPEGAPRLAFLFPGQGIQKAGMARQIYESEPEFGRCVDQCFAFIRDKFGLDLHNSVYPSRDASSAGNPLARPSIGLPALFSFEYALARLWMSWGVKPQGLIGHSFGEYVAACIAGVFSVEEGLWLATMRGRLMEKLPRGAMTAVRLSATEVAPYLPAGVAVAAANSSKDCTISGSLSDLEQVEQRLQQRGIASRRLDVPYAYHSPMVDSILNEFGNVLTGISFSHPNLPFISNLTGTWVGEHQVTTEKYWVDQMRHTVQFSRGLDALHQSSYRLYLEVAPGAALVPLVKQHLPKADTAAFASFDSSRAVHGDAAAMQHTLGQLWSRGFDVEWPQFYRYEKRRRVPLPTYPFERTRHWIEADTGEELRALVSKQSPVSGLSRSERVARNGSGQTSVQEIPDTSASRQPGKHFSHRNEIERVLFEIWSEVLGVSATTITESFFELGGDSLTIAQVYARLKQKFVVDLSLAEMFSALTIEELSLLLQKEVKRKAGLPINEGEAPFYCAFRIRMNGEPAEVYLTEHEFKRVGVVESAEQFRLIGNQT